MNVKYKTLITTAGAAKFAAATAGGTKITLTHMAVGDGGGKLPVPDVSQTKLIGEKWRAALNKISVDARHNNYVVAELVIPPEVGGFWLREMGLYDADGTLVAVASMAESYKPELAEGSGRAQTLRMVIIVSAIESVDLTVDATMVMATQDYIDDKLAEHEQSRRHPDATLAAKGFTQLSSATDSTSEALAATPKAVKAAFDMGDTANKNADTRLAKSNNLSDVADKSVARQNLGLKGAAILDTGTAAGTVAAGDDPRIVNALQKGNNLSDVQSAGAALSNLGGVPVGRKINGHPMTGDMAVTTQDIFDGQAIEIGGGQNLNNYYTPGLYYQPSIAQASNGQNYPEATAGSLMVLRTTTGNGVTQIFRRYAGSACYSRTLYNGTWTEWSKVYDTANKPTAADVGAVAGSGGSYNSVFKFSRVETLPTESNMSALYNATGTNGSIVSGAEFHWYADQINLGITRGNSYGASGFAVVFNGSHVLNIDANGSVYAKAGIYESSGSGGVRVYSSNNKPRATDVDAISASQGGTFQNPVSVNNVTAGNPVTLSGPSPSLVLNETDTGKKYYFVVDGAGIRLQEDSSVGRGVFSWQPDVGVLQTSGILKAGGNVISGGGVFESNGGVRVYSSNNLPPSGLTGTGNNAAYYTHANGQIFMQCVGGIYSASNANPDMTVYLPASFPNGILAIGGSYSGSGGKDNASWWTATPVSANAFTLSTRNMTGTFSFVVTGW